MCLQTAKYKYFMWTWLYKEFGDMWHALLHFHIVTETHKAGQQFFRVTVQSFPFLSETESY